MSDSFGFGGTDTALVFAEPERVRRARVAGDARRRRSPAAATVGPLGVLGRRGRARLPRAGARRPRRGPSPSSAADHLDVGARAAARSRGQADHGGDRAGARRRAALPRSAAPTGVGAVVGLRVREHRGLHRVHAARLRQGPEAREPGRLPQPRALVARWGTRRSTSGSAGPSSRRPISTRRPRAPSSPPPSCARRARADAIFAGSVEEASLADRALPRRPSARGSPTAAQRSEGAACSCSRRRRRRRARGAPRARAAAWWGSWRGDARPLADAPRPSAAGQVAVFCGRDDARVRAALEGSPWADVPRRSVAARAGDHEGAGGFAAAAAVAALAAGEVERALVLGVAPDRGVRGAARAGGVMGAGRGALCVAAALAGCAPRGRRPREASFPAPTQAEWARARADPRRDRGAEARTRADRARRCASRAPGACSRRAARSPSCRRARSG